MNDPESGLEENILFVFNQKGEMKGLVGFTCYAIERREDIR